jgi:hypothetical protein
MKEGRGGELHCLPNQLEKLVFLPPGSLLEPSHHWNAGPLEASCQAVRKQGSYMQRSCVLLPADRSPAEDPADSQYQLPDVSDPVFR